MEQEHALDPLEGIDLDGLRALALTTQEQIEKSFPGRLVITPEELASVWKGNTTRATVQGIREKLKAGVLIPGLKRQGGRWLIPVAGIVTALDNMVEDAEQARQIVVRMPSASPIKKRRKTNIGPRAGINTFWSEVYTAIQEQEAFDMRVEIRNAIPDGVRPSKKKGIVF